MPKSVRFNLNLLRLKNKYFSQQQFLILLSVLIGFASGLVAVVLKNLSYFIQQLLTGKYLATYHYSYYFIFPLIGLALVYLIVNFIYKRQVGQGIVVTLYSISRKKGILERFQSYASLITAPLTIGFGGSVGLEAPTVVTGASLGSRLSRYFKMNQAARTLLVGCAAAAAMSSIFKAPIAGIIFAIEIFSLDLTLASMIPLLTASVSAILTSYFFFGNDIILHTILEDEFDVSDVPFYVLLGLFSAVVSLYFSKVYFTIFKWFKKLNNKAIRMLVGGVVLGILIFIAPALYGEGYEVINSLLQQDYLQALGNNFFNDYLDQQLYVILFLVIVFIFKSIATSVTIAAGGIGGIFAPVLFMGSTMGNAFALLVNSLGFKQISVTNFTLVGMAGLMAGIMHAPLTAIFLIAEITSGYGLFIPLMITAGISFFITSQIQPHSVYTIELAQRGDLLTHNKDQTVLTLMDIRQEIETNFIPLNINYNLGEIVKVGVVNSSRNIFPVVDKNHIFKGVILLDDIRTIMFDQSLYEEVKVIDIMQQAPEVIDLNNCTMKDIMQKFQNSNAWNLPVVENDKYKGFVSKSKLLTAYRQKLIELSV
ncbi:chloride channel protein [Psychroflexus planctonicus]|uniref:Chloride channel protein n=1 Tax=Psychroflexus planctonicus TaxID=1526575 RepID=A0ABQ1SHI4_9FLAO|nr:chloride channel protein [Psychroflexus planctonicus]GGE34561.1 chloride channel protein [Psychroflexus planctonicus]